MLTDLPRLVFQGRFSTETSGLFFDFFQIFYDCY